jgi:cytochrome c oxidase subunit 2
MTAGEGLLRQAGCLDCHSTDGTSRLGPTLKGLYDSDVEVFTAGKKRIVIADEEYCRRSILEPEADVVTGYRDMMPSEKGRLTDEEIRQIVEFLRNLR